METDRAPRANADRSAGSDGDVDMMFARRDEGRGKKRRLPATYLSEMRFIVRFKGK